MPLKVGDKVTVKGIRFRITSGTAKGKKLKAVPVSGKGKSYNFGAKGYKIKPNTKAGDSYCSRSLGIKKKSTPQPNDFSRLHWNCVGKKSVKRSIKTVR